MKKTGSTLLIAILSGVIAVVVLAACTHEPQDDGASEAGEQVDPVVPIMTSMHSFLYKAGLSLRKDNLELADFYLHEIEEMNHQLKQIQEFEGNKIAEPATELLEPHLQKMAKTIDTGDSRAALSDMQAVIDGCNACHAATNHDFIYIVDTSNEQNPLMQSFQK